jgi:hypothetical protein
MPSLSSKGDSRATRGNKEAKAATPTALDAVARTLLVHPVAGTAQQLKSFLNDVVCFARGHAVTINDPHRCRFVQVQC